LTLETSSLKQDAVLWPFSSFNASGDIQVSVATPVKVRWESISSESVSAEVAPEAKNISVYVDRVISVGSVMRLGKLRQLPTPVDKVMEVINYDEVPDIKARYYQRTVTLRKYGNTLPTIV